MARNLRLISWNVKGLNNLAKAHKVLQHVQSLKGEIVFLQETHLCSSEVSRLKRQWVGHLFHSRFSDRSRGAAILIHKDVPFLPDTTLADPNGRYVIVAGQLQNIPVVLACVYAPTWDDEKFISHLFSTLPDITDRHLIIGADFNLVQDPALDRSSSKTLSLSNSAKTLQYHATQLGLSDPWRCKFPSSQAFSFFSHVHHTYSRIDFFLLDNRLMHLVNTCEYHSIVISDHAPTSVDITLPQGKPTVKRWQLNHCLLSDDDFKEFLSKEISFFFQTNDTPDISRSTLWDTCKAYLRGQIISFMSQVRKREKSRLSEIEMELRNIDSKYSKNPTPSLYSDRVKLQSEYDMLLTNRTLKQMLVTKQRFFEQGDKAGKLLAHQARAATTSRLIHSIKTHSGDTVSDPDEINQTLSKHYSTLYTSESPLDMDLTTTPLNQLSFPTIPNDLADDLGKPITVSEVQEAIKSLQSGKSPGPDGFTVEFYKLFSATLAPVLVAVFNEAFKEGRLPPSMCDASISLLLKKDKDPLLCGSYRPISLLNVDVKILAKVLCARLQQVMSLLVSPDQTGFITGRQSFFNTRRLLNILLCPGSDNAEVVVSLDAQTAFDVLEWKYLFFVLDKFGFNSDLISWIKLLYASPKASVRTNDQHSPLFSLHRGTRQGCPLSPLLFALAIEPLAIWLRKEERFEGITRFGLVHKLSLFADDLLLYVSNPVSSLPNILNILSEFGKLSGYKLNLQKSELFPINALAKRIPTSHFPFKVVPEGFVYLGIFVTSTLTDIFAKNFLKLLDKCKHDFSRWSTLPISLMGRVNLVKMIILPKFLYLFEHIPVVINKSFFRTLDQHIGSFLWGNKPARIKKSVMYLEKAKGGLSLPNFCWYYWACNINKLLYWVDDGTEMTNCSWLQIELSSSGHALHSVVSSQIPIVTKPYKNPIVSNTLKIWSQFRKHFGLIRSSAIAPILNNHLFPPSCSDPVFRMWATKGLTKITQLYKDQTFSSFAELSTKYDLPNSHLFRYFQIRHYVQHQFCEFPNHPPESELDKILSLSTSRRGLTSTLYNLVHSSCPDPTISLKQTWEQDLGLTISDADWGVILNLTHDTSICARHGLLQCKILHRVHFTNARLAKIYPGRSDACSRCGNSPADHVHMFWSCPKLSAFWSSIFDTLSTALKSKIEPHPLTALFGIPSRPEMHVEQVVAFTTLLARRLILLRWKHSSPPTHDSWIKEILQCMTLEKMRYSLKGSLRTFHKTWKPILTHIESVTVQPEST